MVIAVDGPAGSGKSTVAKRVAQRLGIYYLDTGAMYRAFTFYVLKNKVPLNDLERIRALLNSFDLKISEDGVLIGKEDVTKEIRTEEVTNQVSYISSLNFVRKKMVELQREIGKNRDIIAEGRDIGTVVFANTDYKFFLDASVEERSLRRFYDDKNQDKDGDISSLFSRHVDVLLERPRGISGDRFPQVICRIVAAIAADHAKPAGRIYSSSGACFLLLGC